MKKLISQQDMSAFINALNRHDVDTVEEISGGLEDLGGFMDDDESLRLSELPKEIPDTVRRRMVALSEQIVHLTNDLTAMLEQLDVAAHKVFEKKDREAEKALPHCATCGQAVPRKKGSRR